MDAGDRDDAVAGFDLGDCQIRPPVEPADRVAGLDAAPHLAALPIGNVPAEGVPGAVNEPGRRGILPNAGPPATTPSYLMPK